MDRLLWRSCCNVMLYESAIFSQHQTLFHEPRLMQWRNGHCTAGCDLRPFIESRKYFASSTKLVGNHTLFRNKIFFKLYWMFIPQFKSYWLVSHRRGLGSIPDQFMSDIWWKKWNWNIFILAFFPCQLSIHIFSISLYLLFKGMERVSIRSRWSTGTSSHARTRIKEIYAAADFIMIS
jgi:hypothetical protein